jgi:hypothetical protein
VVVDNSNSIEKPSRWYQAERTDLSELTRTRLGVTKHSFPHSLGPPRAPGSSFHVPDPHLKQLKPRFVATESDDRMSFRSTYSPTSFGRTLSKSTRSLASSCAGSSSIRGRVWPAARPTSGRKEVNGAAATLGLPAAFDPTLKPLQMDKQNFGKSS